jgi:hypothetical protein
MAWRRAWTERSLLLALLQGSLTTSEEIGPNISALSQIAAQECGRVPPQGLLAAEAVLQAPNREARVGEIHIVDGEHQGFAHAQPVIIDQAKEGSVTGRLDARENAFELVLGEVFA